MMVNSLSAVRTKPILRYPGGKGRLLNFIIPHLKDQVGYKNRLIEPFVGGGAVFFALKSDRAILSDINEELIDLYRGIRRYPSRVWDIFRSLPSTKEGYYKVRNWNYRELDLANCAARTLFLNRTCFKGMWRHNLKGQFNVGYGGQDRRWVINEEYLKQIARQLRKAVLKCADFEETIDSCRRGDFIFLDPPYRPGNKEMLHDHYKNGRFSIEDHQRLALSLQQASRKGIKWAMTTTAHKDIASLFRDCYIKYIPKGTGKRIGELIENSGEILISNY